MLVHVHPVHPLDSPDTFSQPIRQLGHHVVEFPFIQIFRPQGPLSHRWCLKPFCILLSDLIIPRAPPGIVAVHRHGTQHRHRGSYNGRCTEAPSSPKWPLSCRPRGSGTWYLCRFPWCKLSARVHISTLDEFSPPCSLAVDQPVYHFFGRRFPLAMWPKTISKLWYPPISPNASCYSCCSYR